MWKKIFICIVISSLIGQAFPQQKNQKKVKRKYQQTEERNERLPVVKVFGRVLNVDRERLAGAKVTVSQTRFEVHTNEKGEYFLKGMQTGRVRLVVSYAGYRTKYIDYVLQEGVNNVYFTLDKDKITLDLLPVNSQLRYQQLPDIPGMISVISGKAIEESNPAEMAGLSRVIPDIEVYNGSFLNSGMNIRGISNDDNPMNSTPPRISVLTNGIPIHGFNTASTALYDIERVEVIKGPQSTLYGGGGVSGGALQIIPRKPNADFNGFLSSTMGDFRSRGLQMAVNLPVIKDILNIRTSGIYTYRDGYIQNSLGGLLNGKNTIGGRMMVGVMPFWNTNVDLMVTFQKDNLPGMAMINPQFPNSNGDIDPFSREASLNGGRKLKNDLDILGATLEIKRFRNANNYLVSKSSYYTSDINSLQDGDGTAAPAFIISEQGQFKQWTQEIRYDFSRKSRMNGSIGAYYSSLAVNQKITVAPDEQYMAYLILDLPQQLVSADGKIFPVSSIPTGASFGQWAGMALPSVREENNLMTSANQNAEVFSDVTWRISSRLCFSAGIRGSWEWMEVTHESPEPVANFSTLGVQTGKFPNLFYKPAFKTREIENQPGLSFRSNLKIDLAENAIVYAGILRGRRPPAIHFNTLGESRKLNREIVNSISAGFKSGYGNRVWIDISGYFQIFNDLRTGAWQAYDYVIRDTGKATSYGAEAEVKAMILEKMVLFGNYAYTHAQFNILDAKGNAQYWTGKELKLTPEHCFTVGCRMGARISPWAEIFAIPAYSWKSHIWFDDVNTPGMEQQAFGILDASAGVIFPKSGFTISCSGTNLLEEKYFSGAGYPGLLVSDPLFVPGPPRMLQARVTWEF
jgi:iron complex outermembrane recepter protein